MIEGFARMARAVAVCACLAAALAAQQPQKPRRPAGGIEKQKAAAEKQPQGADAELEALRREAGALAGPARAEQTEPEPAGGLAGALNKFNPRVTVFGDFVFTGARGTLRNDSGIDVGDRFSARETELDLRADIDPFAKGVAIFSISETDPGSFEIEPEEVYASFETLPFNLRAKAGRFHTAFGNSNGLHTHDLPQTDRPLAVQTFLGDEGDIETGLSLSWLLPGVENPALRLTYQLVDGENATVLGGSAADDPAHIVRASAFFDLPPASYLELGGSVMVGRADPRVAAETVLAGADVLLKLRPAQHPNNRSLVLQAEAFHLRRGLGTETIDSTGAYLSAQGQYFNWYLGARGDWTQFADRDRGDAWSASAWLSYYTSEFLRLRGGVEYLDDPRQDADWVFFLQMTFVVGAHPPHPYWVNK